MKQLFKPFPFARRLAEIWWWFTNRARRINRDRVAHSTDQDRNEPRDTLPCASVPHPEIETVVRTVRGTADRGSFYLVFTRDRQVGVVLGDVSVEDAADPRLTEAVRRSVMFLLEIGSVERLFAELIHHLPRQRGQLCVRLLGVVAAPETEEIHIYNAGHSPVLLLTGDDQVYALATAPPIGMAEGASVTPQSRAFRAYDTLFIASDELFKLWAPDGGTLTIDELEEMVHRSAADTLDEWVSGIAAALGAFRPASKELTPVAMQMRPEKSRAALLPRLPNRASDA